MSRRFSDELSRLRDQLDEAEPLTRAELDAGLRSLRGAAGVSRRPRRIWLLAPAVVAVVVLIIGIIFLDRASQREEEAGLAILSGAECVQRWEGTLAIDPCSEEVDLSVGPEAKDVALSRGRARFVVAKRGEARRFSIEVSHGLIVVIGTRFLVEQRSESGSVEVEEGTVEFQWSDGSPTDRIGAGGTLVWPRPLPPPSPEPAPPPPSREPPPPPPRSVPAAKKLSARQMMQRLFQLKSQRRFDEAIELLDEGSRRRDFTAVQRERLSFELGNVLRQAGKQTQACLHLRDHLRRFAETGRRTEIERALRDCP